MLSSFPKSCSWKVDRIESESESPNLKKKKNYLIYYLFIYGRWDFIAVWGLSPVVASRGYSLVAARAFLIAVASLIGEQGL